LPSLAATIRTRSVVVTRMGAGHEGWSSTPAITNPGAHASGAPSTADVSARFSPRPDGCAGGAPERRSAARVDSGSRGGGPVDVVDGTAGGVTGLQLAIGHPTAAAPGRSPTP